jgi:adenine-specific DNA-methyltransferase
MPELIWDGTHDAKGGRVAPLRVALPFQTVETVNESAQDRQRSLDLFGAGQQQDWRNRLIWGDKKYVLPGLLEEFVGAVDLVYIDPPFATGQDFSLPIEVHDMEFTKEPSLIEVKAYRDTWGSGLDTYLQWFSETVELLHDLLSDTGSLIVHLDYRVGQYAKVVLDELFSPDDLVTEIIWHYSGAGVPKDRPARRHDNLLWYAKGPSWTFNADEVRTEYAEATKERFSHYIGNVRKGADYGVQELNPLGKWPDDVVQISIEAPSSRERTGYPTQKPRALLEWIIKACSNADDLVLDCFCGSGTTPFVAEDLGRRWIAADLSRFAIHTTRKRLLSIPEVRPFVVQNLGKYERQQWQAAQFGDHGEARTRAYRHFIVDLYKAKPIEGAWLHGIKNGRMVHVGTVDAPVTVGDVTQIATEFRRAVGTGKEAPSVNSVDVLGWDFAFELNELAREQAARANVDMHFMRIPREVLEKRAVEQSDVRFFELAALGVDLKRKGKTATLRLTDFVIPPDEVPADIQQAITKWAQWIDYWAVDWDNKGDTFHNQWQSYRTRKSRDLDMSTRHQYEASGRYTVVAKVIDILGNDTTKELSENARGEQELCLPELKRQGTPPRERSVPCLPPRLPTSLLYRRSGGFPTSCGSGSSQSLSAATPVRGRAGRGLICGWCSTGSSTGCARACSGTSCRAPSAPTPPSTAGFGVSSRMACCKRSGPSWCASARSSGRSPGSGRRPTG